MQTVDDVWWNLVSAASSYLFFQKPFQKSVPALVWLHGCTTSALPSGLTSGYFSCFLGSFIFQVTKNFKKVSESSDFSMSESQWKEVVIVCPEILGRKCVRWQRLIMYFCRKIKTQPCIINIHMHAFIICGISYLQELKYKLGKWINFKNCGLEKQLNSVGWLWCNWVRWDFLCYYFHRLSKTTQRCHSYEIMDGADAIEKLQFLLHS